MSISHLDRAQQYLDAADALRDGRVIVGNGRQTAVAVSRLLQLSAKAIAAHRAEVVRHADACGGLDLSDDLIEVL